MKALFTLILAAFISACTQIDTGNVGVESALGQVKTDPLPPGLYQTMFKTVTELCAKEVPVSIENLKPQTSDKITLQDLDIDLYIRLNPTLAPAAYIKWPGDFLEVKGDGCTRVGTSYVTRQAREVVYNAASKFSSQDVHLERAEIAALVVKELQQNLDSEAGKGMFNVISANVKNLITDPALEENIKSAAKAQFELQAQKNKLEVTKIEAEREREKAKGEADAIRIKAEAVAKQGGAEYVQLQAIQKWNGVLPTTNAGGAVPFINVK